MSRESYTTGTINVGSPPLTFSDHSKDTKTGLERDMKSAPNCTGGTCIEQKGTPLFKGRMRGRAGKGFVKAEPLAPLR